MCETEHHKGLLCPSVLDLFISFVCLSAAIIITIGIIIHVVVTIITFNIITIIIIMMMMMIIIIIMMIITIIVILRRGCDFPKLSPLLLVTLPVTGVFYGSFFMDFH